MSLLIHGEVRNSLDTLREVDKAMFRQPNVVGDGTTGRCGEAGRPAQWVVSGAGVRVSIVPLRANPREVGKAKPHRGKGDRKVEA
jgi:hypothetical protein